jgi:hypothetical protein
MEELVVVVIGVVVELIMTILPWLVVEEAVDMCTPV